jgi:hypothetical protein
MHGGNLRTATIFENANHCSGRRTLGIVNDRKIVVILAGQPFSFSMESNAVSRERYGVVLGTCQVVLTFVPDDGRTYLAVNFRQRVSTASGGCAPDVLYIR